MAGRAETEVRGRVSWRSATGATESVAGRSRWSRDHDGVKERDDVTGQRDAGDVRWSIPRTFDAWEGWTRGGALGTLGRWWTRDGTGWMWDGTWDVGWKRERGETGNCAGSMTKVRDGMRHEEREGRMCGDDENGGTRGGRDGVRTGQDWDRAKGCVCARARTGVTRGRLDVAEQDVG